MPLGPSSIGSTHCIFSLFDKNFLSVGKVQCQYRKAIAESFVFVELYISDWRTVREDSFVASVL